MRRRVWIPAVVVALGLLLWFTWDREPPVATPVVAKKVTARPPRPTRAPSRTAPPREPREPAPQGRTRPEVSFMPPGHGQPFVEDTDEAEPAEVTVHVVDPRGQGGRMRPRCTNVVPDAPEKVSETTTIWRFTARAGPCSVQGMRKDGALPAWTDEVNLDLVSGESYDVVLELPAERTGGLGVAFEPVEQGMLVTSVHAGTPAEALGLEPGDVIVEVDGLPTAALSGVEFQQVLAGPEGTAVQFLVARGDQEPQPYEIVRSFVER